MRLLLLAGAIAAAALELERYRRELELLARQDRHLERQISVGDELVRLRVNELVRTLGPIVRRVDELERFVGGDALQRQAERIDRLGTVRLPGTLHIAANELARIRRERERHRDSLAEDMQRRHR